MDTTALKNRALAHLHNQQLKEARDLYSQATRLNPSDIDAWHMLSGINGMLGLYKDSQSCARKVIKLQPTAVPAYINLGAALLAQDKLNDAMSAFHQALKLNPDNPEAHNNLGNIWIRKNNTDKAKICYKKAIKLKADFAEAHNNLGNIYLKENRILDAQTCFKTALTLNPMYPDALFNLGSTLQNSGHTEQALAAYNRVLSMQPGHKESLFAIATLYNETGQHEHAIKYYTIVRNIDSTHTDAFIGTGLAYQKMRQHAQAISQFENAIQIQPDRAEIYHYIGVSLKENGDTEQAAGFFRKALELDPDFVQSAHFLASLGHSPIPDKADSRYVTALFDEYADNFDDHLVCKLEYKTPEVLEQLVTPLLGPPDSQFDVLDLGCGTGLCAPRFSPWCKTLVGVDLSSKMIEKARTLGLYTDLVVGDLLDAINSRSTDFNLILAADVFVYIGNLDGVIASSCEALKPGGILAFSVERLNEESDKDFILHEGGRYAHANKYIEDHAFRAGLTLHTSTDTVLRKEKGVPVKGRIYAYIKK